MSAITLKLRDMAHGGDAVGLYEGKAVFVPLGIPGETVRVQSVEQHKRFARGRLLEVLEPSPERVSPLCPYFGLCGGCRSAGPSAIGSTSTMRHNCASSAKCYAPNWSISASKRIRLFASPSA